MFMRGKANRVSLLTAAALALPAPLAWGQAAGKEAKSGGPTAAAAPVERAEAARPPSLELNLPAPAGLPLLPLSAGGPSWLQPQQGPHVRLLLPVGAVSPNAEERAAGTTVEGAWQSTADGRLWRVQAASPGADSLRVHFQDFDVGTGSVWLHTANGQIAGPYNGKGISGNGDFWSDVVFGDSAVIEYQPGWTAVAQDAAPFRIAAVSHIRGEAELIETEEPAGAAAAKSPYGEIGYPTIENKAAEIGIEKDAKSLGTSRKNTALRPGRSVHFDLDTRTGPDLHYWLDVGPDVSRVRFELRGDYPSSEDLDLYVRYGERVRGNPNSPFTRDYSSRGDSGNETITLMRPETSGGDFPNLKTGRWYVAIELYGQGSASGTLTAHVVTMVPSAGGARLTPGRPSRFRIGPHDFSGSRSWIIYTDRQYRLEVPTNPTRVIFDMKNDDPSEDVDIYVRHGRPVEYSNGSIIRDHSSAGERGDERIIIDQPIPGTYYLALRIYGNPYRVIAEGTVTGYVEADAPLPTVSLTAQPASIRRGESATLRWSSTNAARLSISPGIGAVSTSGSRRVSPTSTTTYRITATNADGETASDSATVTVAAQPAPTVSLTAQPASIRRGESATLQWSSTNAESLRISPGIGAVSASGSRRVSPTSTTTYRITATNADGQTASDSATVTVNAPPDTPVISSDGIVLATGTPVVSTIAPLALISVFGEGFAPAGTQELSPRLDSSGEIAANLSNTCLEMGGQRMPLFAVTPTQINAQTMRGARGRTDVRVIRNCGTGSSRAGEIAYVEIAETSPAFFNFENNPDGRNAIVALHGGGPGLAGPPGLIPGLQFTPAEPGGVVTFFGTGFGTTDPWLEPGQIPARVLPNGIAGLTNDVSFTIGGAAVPAEDVLYAGTLPCCAGLYQFVLRVPQRASRGAAPVTANVAGVSTVRGPFLTIGGQSDPSPSRNPGERFRDCPECPEMVVVQAGSFLMGSPESEEGRFDNEGPQHRVTIPAPFAVGVYEVTFEEWDACVGRGCGFVGVDFVVGPSDEGWGRGRRPVIHVTWRDVQEYVEWLSVKTGEEYRLLSEAEWEYAARAGSRARYSFGDEITTSDANYGENIGKTQRVGSYRANGFGLHDMHGNVAEWVQDCWNGSYDGAPTNGSAWERGDCSRRVIRGGSWIPSSGNLRSALRDRNQTGFRSNDSGFRVARTLRP